MPSDAIRSALRLADEIDDPGQLATARDGVVRGWTAAGVVGAMPNIVAIG